MKGGRKRAVTCAMPASRVPTLMVTVRKLSNGPLSRPSCLQGRQRGETVALFPPCLPQSPFVYASRRACIAPMPLARPRPQVQEKATRLSGQPSSSSSHAPTPFCHSLWVRSVTHAASTPVLTASRGDGPREAIAAMAPDRSSKDPRTGARPVRGAASRPEARAADVRLPVPRGLG